MISFEEYSSELNDIENNFIIEKQVNVRLFFITVIENYPTVELFSLDETLNFIEKNKDKIYYYHFNEVSKKDWKERLFVFWNEYPNGMIDMGNILKKK
jgi:transposase